MVTSCLFSSTKLEDIELIDSYYYNKMEYIRFNSTVGKYVGYTEFGVKDAERWNSGPELVQARAERERYCLHNVGIDYQAALTKSGESVCELHQILMLNLGFINTLNRYQLNYCFN